MHLLPLLLTTPGLIGSGTIPPAAGLCSADGYPLVMSSDIKAMAQLKGRFPMKNIEKWWIFPLNLMISHSFPIQNVTKGYRPLNSCDCHGCQAEPSDFQRALASSSCFSRPLLTFPGQRRLCSRFYHGTTSKNRTTVSTKMVPSGD